MLRILSVKNPSTGANRISSEAQDIDGCLIMILICQFVFDTIYRGQTDLTVEVSEVRFQPIFATDPSTISVPQNQSPCIGESPPITAW